MLNTADTQKHVVIRVSTYGKNSSKLNAHVI